MPELPEVETVRRELEAELVGHNVAEVIVRETRLRLPVDARSLRRGTCDRRLEAIRRRAKYLVLDFEGGQSLLIHLGMSGSLRLCSSSEKLLSHDHVSLSFDDGRWLHFRDPRRFGLIVSRPCAGLDADPLLAHLGPEPLSTDFHVDYLRERAKGSRRDVKSFLMDAKVVVGIGNIYASEALYRAKVHPKRAAGRIAAPRWALVHNAARKVLLEAIEAGGTTLNDYRRPDGGRGNNGDRLLVYGREGLPCRCGVAEIRRIVQQNRATYYCAHCQR